MMMNMMRTLRIMTTMMMKTLRMMAKRMMMTAQVDMMRTLRIMMTMMMTSQVEGVSPADVSERTDSGLGLNFENLEMSLSRENLQLSRSDLERLFGKKEKLCTLSSV